MKSRRFVIEVIEAQRGVVLVEAETGDEYLCKGKALPVGSISPNGKLKKTHMKPATWGPNPDYKPERKKKAKNVSTSTQSSLKNPVTEKPEGLSDRAEKLDKEMFNQTTGEIRTLPHGHNSMHAIAKRLSTEQIKSVCAELRKKLPHLDKEDVREVLQRSASQMSYARGNVSKELALLNGLYGEYEREHMKTIVSQVATDVSVSSDGSIYVGAAGSGRDSSGRRAAKTRVRESEEVKIAAEAKDFFDLFNHAISKVENQTKDTANRKEDKPKREKEKNMSKHNFPNWKTLNDSITTLSAKADDLYSMFEGGPHKSGDVLEKLTDMVMALDRVDSLGVELSSAYQKMNEAIRWQARVFNATKNRGTVSSQWMEDLCADIVKLVESYEQEEVLSDQNRMKDIDKQRKAESASTKKEKKRPALAGHQKKVWDALLKDDQDTVVLEHGVDKGESGNQKGRLYSFAAIGSYPNGFMTTKSTVRSMEKKGYLEEMPERRMRTGVHSSVFYYKVIRDSQPEAPKAKAVEAPKEEKSKGPKLTKVQQEAVNFMQQNADRGHDGLYRQGFGDSMSLGFKRQISNKTVEALAAKGVFSLHSANRGTMPKDTVFTYKFEGLGDEGSKTKDKKTPPPSKADANFNWTKGNNAGNGYEVGSEDDDINEIEGIGELVVRASSSSEVAVYRKPDGSFVGVGDAEGPWAVDL